MVRVNEISSRLLGTGTARPLTRPACWLDELLTTPHPPHGHLNTQPRRAGRCWRGDRILTVGSSLDLALRLLVGLDRGFLDAADRIPKRYSSLVAQNGCLAYIFAGRPMRLVASPTIQGEARGPDGALHEPWPCLATKSDDSRTTAPRARPESRAGREGGTAGYRRRGPHVSCAVACTPPPPRPHDDASCAPAPPCVTAARWSTRR